MPKLKANLLDFPPIERLQAGLRSSIASPGLDSAGLIVTDRHPNPYSTTFPSEIVSCRLSSGQIIDVFCKYLTDTGNKSYGHRGGMGYEIKVYKNLLTGLDLSLPTLYGVHEQENHAETWLITQYLDDASKLTKVSSRHSSKAMLRAAAWLGAFHAQCSEIVSSPELSFLNRYDENYYRGWAARVANFIPESIHVFPWLEAVCESFGDVVSILTSTHPTILHGEFYSQNVLYWNEDIYPVDWESTAVGPGEIDINTLIESWPGKEADLIHEYEKTRWSGETPKNIKSVYYAAQIYLQMRWISDFSGKLRATHWRWKKLYGASVALGLL
jgi:aminoglycoside phosphotransferase (APT) family kinase protein